MYRYYERFNDKYLVQNGDTLEIELVDAATFNEAYNLGMIIRGNIKSEITRRLLTTGVIFETDKYIMRKDNDDNNIIIEPKSYNIDKALIWFILDNKLYSFNSKLTEGGLNSWSNCEFQLIGNRLANIGLVGQIRYINFDYFDTSRIENFSDMFNNIVTLETFIANNLDLSHTAEMTSMFSGCIKLKYVKLGTIGKSKVFSLSSMFEGCENLLEVDLDNFDTSEVLYMTRMFKGCERLRTINIKSFNTPKLERMGGMFWDCKRLEEIDLSNFDTSKVIIMSDMFKDCINLKKVNLTNLVTNRVVTIGAMFYRCASLTELDLRNFQLSGKIDTWLVSECTNLKEIILNKNNVFYVNKHEEHLGITDEMKVTFVE